MSDDDRLHELLLEWESRCERGEDPSPAELCKSCPHLVGPLEAEIAKLRPWQLRTDAPRDATRVWPPPTAAFDGMSPASNDKSLPTASFAGRRFQPTERFDS